MAGLSACGGEPEEESLSQALINGGPGGLSLSGSECESLGCEVSSDGIDGCPSTWRCKCTTGTSCIDETCTHLSTCCGGCCRRRSGEFGCPGSALKVLPALPASPQQAVAPR
jgi:hypothetical protein